MRFIHFALLLLMLCWSVISRSVDVRVSRKQVSADSGQKFRGVGAGSAKAQGGEVARYARTQEAF